jgi:hypothetical protein
MPSFFLRTLGALPLLAMFVRTVSAEVCEAGVWSSGVDGALNDPDNWMNGAPPSVKEFAVIDSDDNITIALDEEGFGVYSLIIGGQGGTGDIVLLIGEEVPTTLYIGEDTAADPCVDEDDEDTCVFEELILSKAYVATPVGTGVMVDLAGETFVDDVYNAFNLTCADDYIPDDPDVTYELVSCPFEANYTTADLESLSCSLYESEWCSAGILSTSEDVYLEDAEWLYGRKPTE